MPFSSALLVGCLRVVCLCVCVSVCLCFCVSVCLCLCVSCVCVSMRVCAWLVGLCSFQTPHVGVAAVTWCRWIDIDNGGTITAVELTSAVRRGPPCALKKNLANVFRMFTVLDADGSGSLDADEWIGNVMGCRDPLVQSWVLMMMQRLSAGTLSAKAESTSFSFSLAATAMAEKASSQRAARQGRARVTMGSSTMGAYGAPSAGAGRMGPRQQATADMMANRRASSGSKGSSAGSAPPLLRQLLSRSADAARSRVAERQRG